MLLREIDELTRNDHSLLDASCKCYFFAEYPSGNRKENEGNPIYSLINNLKKSVDKKGLPEYKYKLNDIQICSNALIELFLSTNNIGDFTLVPIPPSKSKNHPLYDPRILQILEGLKPKFDNCDIKELISSKEDMIASHKTLKRPKVMEIFNNYVLDESLISGVKDKVILFDDVLTSGAHFQAAKRKILEYFPLCEVIGFFIARRIFPDPLKEFQDDTEGLPF